MVLCHTVFSCYLSWAEERGEKERGERGASSFVVYLVCVTSGVVKHNHM